MLVGRGLFQVGELRCMEVEQPQVCSDGALPFVGSRPPLVRGHTVGWIVNADEVNFHRRRRGRG